MKLIAFNGPSDSGKTWMIERLVRLWTSRGLRVGVVKHCSKGYQLDREGKDSSRFWEGGAAAVAVVGPGEWAVRRREPEADPARVAQEAFPTGIDVAIVEGFREASIPRVRVFGSSELPSVKAGDTDVIAFVSRTPAAALAAPVFALTDEQGLSDFLVRHLGLELRAPAPHETTLLRHERVGTRSSRLSG
ncbi:MAG: molybdopterin-guanine dinucleotide biosynthesis protein B [Planctomycetota bacterium]